jgi:hypothetical protein
MRLTHCLSLTHTHKHTHIQQDYLAHCQSDLKQALIATLLPPASSSSSSSSIGNDDDNEGNADGHRIISLRRLYAPVLGGKGKEGGVGGVVRGGWPEGVVGVMRDQCEVCVCLFVCLWVDGCGCLVFVGGWVGVCFCVWVCSGSLGGGGGGGG